MGCYGEAETSKSGKSETYNLALNPNRLHDKAAQCP